MKKKLYRNTEEALLGGVVAGLADYYKHDAVFFRLIFVVFIFLTGLMPGILIYLVAWVLIPEPPTITPADSTDYTVYE